MNRSTSGGVLHRFLAAAARTLLAASAIFPLLAPQAFAGTLAQAPLYITASQPPLILLTMARDHKLYYEAYNDYSDLDGDGTLDVGYKPGSITYYGYFDSYKCYNYSSGIYTPVAMSDSTTDADGNVAYTKKCVGAGDYWSGDFLNYVTTSRMDALRRVLYGGYRSTDSTTQTILERAFIPQDAHAWGKEYESVARDGYDITQYTPLSLPTSGTRHLFANVTLASDSDTPPTTGYGRLPLMRVLTNSTNRIWNWVSIERPVAGTECATDNNSRTNCATGGAVMTDYTVRVEVCKLISSVSADAYYGRESNCKAYSDGAATPTITYKPTGLLHTYGDNNGMFFGLLTGSYDQNTNGGIMRKAVSSITSEIEATTGIFKESGTTCGAAGATACAKGIVGTINRLHITGFTYRYSTDPNNGNNYSYYNSSSCQWIFSRQMNDGECEMWGNPLAEMMYEGLRYFSGATTATSAFTSSSSRDNSVYLPGATSSGLPRLTTWTNPFTATPATPIPDTGPFPSCARPFFMLISDVSPSFDSESVPGTDSNFGSTGTASINGASLNASSLGQTLWNYEFSGGGSKNVFIGQVGSTYDGAPTVKSATSFGNLRGLAPSDPTRQGSYYSASLAHFSKINDVNSISGGQKITTYSIALSAPLPTIQIPIPGTSSFITIVPFAKTVKRSSGDSLGTVSEAQGAFQPTNQIVDFYVDSITNTTTANTNTSDNGGRPHYKFRINYEAMEQGGDHDMDAMAVYDIKLNTDNSATVRVDSQYAAAGSIQHMGYVISGTTADGIYLVVRDTDTSYSSDPEYFLDRPNSSDSGTDSSNYRLPTNSFSETTTDPTVPNASNFATRTFTANTSTSSATLLNDPLWYAAKFGGFNDINGDNVPQSNEWDADGDGVPDTYFLVVNPLKMLAQLDAALTKIRDSIGTSAALTSNSFSFQTDTLIYQARFNTDGWSGELIAYPVTSNSIGNPSWQAQVGLADKSGSERVILTYDPDQTSSKGIPFLWANMKSTGTTTLRDALNKTSAGTTDTLGSSRVTFLRGDDVSGMRTRPRIVTTTITGSCSGTYTCPSGGGTAVCSESGSVVCTPVSKPNRLGDIINSQAQYVGRPWFGYPDSSYAKFSSDYNASSNSTGKGNRSEMVYVGANDGMLHGFSAGTGEELLAYVPSEMYRQRSSRWLLSKLTETDYGKSGSSNSHRYYVDGTPTMGDICTSTGVSTCPDGNWRTLLVGGLGGGGQGIYALDITDPANFSEANAASIVKWEYSDKNDADLGYTYGRPYIVRLCTSRDNSSSSTPKTCSAWSWYVLFSNGYNNRESDGYVSSSGDAALFVLNANTGALVKKIAVEEGDTTTPNGLSEIAPVDIDGDGTVDYVYAGDLKGNVWRFDFVSDNTNNWAISLKSGSNPLPLYVAWDEQSPRQRQPITTAPDAVKHPQGGLVVTFGTGSYLFDGDASTTQVQTVYGIRDPLDGDVVSSSNRSNLLQQTVNTATAQATTTFTLGGAQTNDTYTYRTISANSIDWTTHDGWYFNLPDSKERIGFSPEVRGGNLLRVTSTVPSSDICEAGGYSWEYFVDVLSGGRLSWSPFVDLQEQQSFGGTTAFASARKSEVGVKPPGVIVTEGKGRGTEFNCGSTGNCDIAKLILSTTTAGRVSWREILSD